MTPLSRLHVDLRRFAPNPIHLTGEKMTNKLKLLGLVAAQLVLMFSSDAEAIVQYGTCRVKSGGTVKQLIPNKGCGVAKGATCAGFKHGDCMGNTRCDTSRPRCCCWN